MSAPVDKLVRRGMSNRLTAEEWEKVCDCCTEIREHPAKTIVSRKGEALDRSLYLVDGIMGRYVPGPYRDLREMVALEIAGDFVDLHSFPLGTLDHDVTAVTSVTVAVLPHARLRKVVAENPAVAISLWRQTVVDAAIHRYWSFRIGALRASGRIANFICEMQTRLAQAGLADETGFDLPLTQTDFGEACGMSAVHVNRVMRELREAGCCTMRDGYVTIIDLGKLRALGHYESAFLELGIDRP